jgi:hypothetical protein
MRGTNPDRGGVPVLAMNPHAGACMKRRGRWCVSMASGCDRAFFEAKSNRQYRLPGMTNTDNRTSFECATREYDREPERALVRATAIAEASIVVDCDALVLRTGETAEALLEALAGVIALSPLSTRSPSAIRKTVENLSKQLHQKISAVRQNESLRQFIRRSFSGGGTKERA